MENIKKFIINLYLTLVGEQPGEHPKLTEIRQKVKEARQFSTLVPLIGDTLEGSEFEIDYVVIIRNSTGSPIICGLDSEGNIYIEGGGADIDGFIHVLDEGKFFTIGGVCINSSGDGVEFSSEPQVWIPLELALTIPELEL